MSRPVQRLRLVAEAAGREAEAARSLAGALVDLRRAAEVLDDDQLQTWIPGRTPPSRMRRRRKSLASK